MDVVIRTDASFKVGAGHVMRCLTLAEELRIHGANVCFVCREESGHMIDIIRSKGFKTHLLSEAEDIGTITYLTSCSIKPDWLIIDHYEWDYRLEYKMKKYVKQIMVIDDLANRKHDCEILLDQNLVSGYLTRYSNLIPLTCKMLLGPQYAIIREEFISLSRNASPKDGKLNRILVFFSASDPTNETVKALQVFQHPEFRKINIDVVVGSINPRKDKIKAICNNNSLFHYHCQVDYMAELMNSADLSIGAGGTAMWERCIMGLPSLIICIANNQIDMIKQLENQNAIKFLGWYNNVGPQDIYKVVKKLDSSSDILQKLSLNSKNIIGNRESPCESIIPEIFDQEI